MQHEIRGADILWGALKKGGVTRVFSLSGNHIMPVYDAAFGEGIEIIHVRHEAAAVHMADAWARLTGEVGVALVTGGQGHSNAVAGLPTALAGEVPILLLSGHAPLNELGLGAFQETPQVEMAAPLCKAAWLAQSTAGLADDIARGFSIARSGRPGPVHISLPTDVVEAKATPKLPQEAAYLAAPMPLAAESAAAILAAIAGAERPLLAAGPALNTPDGRRARAALEAALGLPIALMESPRGLGDPSLGAFAEMLAQSDCVVLLGKPLDFTLRFGRVPFVSETARWVVIEPDAKLMARAAQGLGGRLALSAMAAPLEAMAMLAAHARPHANTGWAAALGEAIAHRPKAWEALAGKPGGPVHPATLGAALRPFITADTVLVVDGGEIGQWMQACLSAPERVINGVAGAIGAALPFAAAARAARPAGRVLAICGDGTFGFHMAEFDTALRHDLPFVLVVGNDAKWNAEYQIQARDYGANRTHGCELAPGTRYDLVVSGLGGHGEFVERGEDLAPALERAFASGKPACVNVLIEGLPAPNLRRA
ncbi:thiamine pyrophosphate-binding protein [Sediminicoccus rosea]|jgi:acetolactate synthase-1/2/3 large subunit|uniref:Thiamine pyrophosphate-binding protein n=1 Tax=Sediminicoccus rosea TaxID=1225128 RepID=A0ABZ0PCL1_9PROT|nr:thiamine pyrophosphate-binding protein [Sediminicoccus rosea]WPB83428.1 thiamine pyrophosphate-binding protein [Sediminicoccus rosea]